MSLVDPAAQTRQLRNSDLLTLPTDLFFTPTNMSLNAPLPDLSTIEEQPKTIENLCQMESNTSASGRAPQEGKTPPR